MPSIDVNSLRRKTQAAVAEHSRKKSEEAILVAERARQHFADEEKRAQLILSHVQSRAEEAAGKGLSSVKVDDLNSNDISHDGPGFLTGSAVTRSHLKHLRHQIVWDEIAKSGLTPYVEDWHDGVGIKSGYHLMAKW